MEARAILRMVRLSPQKGRLVADQVRGMSVGNAVNLLKFSNKRAATIIGKVLWSAVNNAENNLGADIDTMFVTQIFLDEGPRLKRMQPRAKGRGAGIVKRTSHVTVVVGDKR
jgi:large subunit ribosomal protein L22